MERPPPIPIWSVDDLRSRVEQAERGEELFFRIASSVSFDEARKLWETVSVTGGDGALVNLEVLLGKEEARAFVEGKIRELEEWRDLLNGHIGAMTGWCKLMERSLATGGPGVPADYNPMVLHGPKVFLDLSKIGTVPNAATHRQAILDRFDVGAPGNGHGSKNQELPHRRALVKFNISVLKLKIDGLILLKDRLVVGIKSLKQEQFKDDTDLGSGNPEFENFRDIDMVRVYKRNKDQE